MTKSLSTVGQKINKTPMEASRQLNISNRVISDRIKNSTYPNYIYIGEGENPLSKKAKKVIIDEQEYRSMNYSATKLGIDKNHLVRMLENENYVNYKYFEEIEGDS